MSQLLLFFRFLTMSVTAPKSDITINGVKIAAFENSGTVGVGVGEDMAVGIAGA